MTEHHPIPDDVLIDHLAVLAKTGAGKTYLAKGLVERLLEQKRRVCIIDPKNAWWGLKSSADGKSPGFAIVVFGGPKADVPLLAAHGKVLAEAVATSHLSCIICTKGMPEAERIRFLTDFFQTLDQKNSQPLHLVLDEAHMMAPQKPLGEMQRLTHWTSELVSGGRGMGFRIILLSQRPARLNKDVLTQCETLVAMRMTGIQDRDAVKSWIHDQADMETGKEIVSSLTGLQNGEGWLWSPAKDILKRVKFPRITTYDNSKTTRDSGADDRAQLAPVDLDVLQAKLGKVKAEIDANDPKALKAKIVDLEKQLCAKPSNQGTKSNTADETRIRSEDYNAGYQARQKEEAKERATRNKALQAVGSFLERAMAALPPAEIAMMAAGTPKALAQPPRATATVPVPRLRATNATVSTPEGLSGRHMRILNGVAWWLAAGIEEPSRAQIAGASGYAPNNGNFNNLVGALKTAGLIEYPNAGSVRLTDAGTALAEPQDAPTTEELHARVRSIISPRHIKIFDAVIAAYPESMTRDQVAEASGYQAGNGNFNNLVGKIKTLGFIEYPSPGSVRAAEWLFV